MLELCPIYGKPGAVVVRINTKNTLVRINDKNLPVTVAMAYASNNNFTGKPVYKSDQCFLHKDAYECLQTVVLLLKPLRLKIKIWDAFRTQLAQEFLFNRMPGQSYISNPNSGVCSHCRGIALDLTLTDRFDRELDMGTQFHDFRVLAHHGNDMISEEAQRNRLILAGVMSVAGFVPLTRQWWHYRLPNLTKYPIIQPDEIPLSLV